MPKTAAIVGAVTGLGLAVTGLVLAASRRPSRRRAFGDTITMIKGIPHARSSFFETDRPVERVFLFPLPAASGRVQEGDVVTYDAGRGVYHRYDSLWGSRDFPLSEGGATKATVEEREVPPPKTKLQVRWESGRWQKLMKRGWVDA